MEAKLIRRLTTLITALGFCCSLALAAPAPTKSTSVYTPLFQAIRTIEQGYYTAQPAPKLVDKGIAGMLEGLDPYSIYMTPDEWQRLKTWSDGQYSGIGVDVRGTQAGLEVVSPIPDGPADQAGLRPGDTIIAIDGTAVSTSTKTTAINSLRGQTGSSVTLTVERPGGENTLMLDVIRNHITIPALTGEMLGDRIGYIRINLFSEHTADQFRAELSQLLNEGLHGLIIDVRGNPGGAFKPSLAIADDLIDAGLYHEPPILISTRGQQAANNITYHAHGQSLLPPSMPILVLVDRGSASASEVLAVALQSHNRALIMGENTFGKGSIQVVVPLPNLAAIKLTVAHYISALNRDIDGEGVLPDITWPMTGHDAASRCPQAGPGQASGAALSVLAKSDPLIYCAIGVVHQELNEDPPSA